MAKVPRNVYSPTIKNFLKNLETVASLPVSKRYSALTLAEFPYDGQLLAASALYRQSRKLYNSLGGTFVPRLISTMRGLSTQDLFKDEIEFTPSASEYIWFKDHVEEVFDPEAQVLGLMRFNEISLYHEQNHRIVWRVLPPAPAEQRDLMRYLNFAESLVVTLDLALGDQLGKKVSNAFEQLKLIYRPGGEDEWFAKSKREYRAYLMALLYSTYLLLERVDTRDILKAMDFVLPGQKKMNKDALKRSLQLSEMFTENTNPQWQSLYWQKAQQSLEAMHIDSDQEILFLAADPLDIEEELSYADRLFDLFGI